MKSRSTHCGRSWLFDVLSESLVGRRTSRRGDPPAVTTPPKPSRPMGELEPELPPLDDAFDLLGPTDWEEM